MVCIWWARPIRRIIFGACEADVVVAVTGWENKNYSITTRPSTKKQFFSFSPLMHISSSYSLSKTKIKPDAFFFLCDWPSVFQPETQTFRCYKFIRKKNTEVCVWCGTVWYGSLVCFSLLDGWTHAPWEIIFHGGRFASKWM